MSFSKHGWRVCFFVAIAVAFSVSAFAEEGMRRWRDQSGKFEVEAKLITQADGKVQLLKKDGLAIWVPLTALSDADQQYLKNLPKANPFAGGSPLNEVGAPGAAAGSAESGGTAGGTPTTTQDLFAAQYKAKALPSDGPLIFLNAEEPLPPLEPDPAPALPKLQPLARPFAKLDAYAGVSAPMLVDLEQPAFAVSAHRTGNAVDPATFGRVYLFKSGENQPKTALDIKVTLLLLDHHVASKRSLAVINMDNSGHGGDLLLLEDLATGKPRPVARWRLPGWDKPGSKPRVKFARLLDGDRAVVVSDYSLYVWDLDQGKLLLKIERLSGDQLQVSGTGKYLAIPVSKGCKLVDLVKGELLGQIPFPGVLRPEVGFSPNGRQLAMVAGNQFVVWDLTRAAVSADATLAVPCGNFSGWIGDRYLLTQLGGLIDPELGVSLWRYTLPPGAPPLTMPGGVAVVSKITVAALYCMPVPHAPVGRLIERLAADDGTLLVVRPGSEVALEVESTDGGADEAAIRAALQKGVERAGWKVNPESAIRVTARVSRGQKQKFSFRRINDLFGPGETAEITPYTGSLNVRLNNEVLWSSTKGNMVPAVLHLQPGETVQQAAKKWEVADPGYFERLPIPAMILRPEVSKSVGRSSIHDGTWRDY